MGVLFHSTESHVCEYRCQHKTSDTRLRQSFRMCARYVTNPLFFHGITFGVSINASLAKTLLHVPENQYGDNIKIACTSGEIENLMHQFHPCDGVVPELANDENLRMKIDANNVANLHELLKEQNIGFYTGKLGLSKILAKKVMVRLEAFSSFASSQNDKNTAGKNKASVRARKSTQVSALSVYQPLLKCGGQLENNSGPNCNNSIIHRTRLNAV